MFKNLIQKLMSGIIVVSMVFAGVALAPAAVHADNGLHLGWGLGINGILNGLHLGVGTNTKVKADKKDDKDDKDDDKIDDSLNIQDNMFVSAVKTARIKFKSSVKDANVTFRSSQKTAKADFKASVKAATDQQGRIAALKTYLRALLTAFKARSASIEVALQAFIDTDFNVNQAPVANAQNVNLNENTSASITLTGSDPEGSPLTYIMVSNTVHGTLSGTAPSLTYTPNTNFSGSDSFTFKVSDGSLMSALATVSITVTGTNHPPVANNQNVTLSQNTSANITLTGSDPEGSTLVFIVVSSTTHGTLSGIAPNLIYTPSTGFTGSDSFTFKVNDGSLNSTLATVSIMVNP